MTYFGLFGAAGKQPGDGEPIGNEAHEAFSPWGLEVGNSFGTSEGLEELRFA